MPTFSSYEIYQYSDAILKHLPEKLLKELQKTLLCGNKSVVYDKTTIDRQTYNSTTLADITDGNLDNKIALFQNKLKDELHHKTYSISQQEDHFL